MTGRPTIGISDYAASPNSMKRRLYDRLDSWAEVVHLDPDEEHPDLAGMGLDLFHLARWSRASLCDLERAQAAGIPTVNGYEGAAATEDRLGRCRRLEEAGIRVPEYDFGVAEEITLEPPVVVKPRHELEPAGHEFEVVYSGPLAYDGERLVQRYVVPHRSYKVFRVGEHVRATRHSPGFGVSRQARATARESATPRPVVGLVDRVESLFGLALFELDLVLHKGLYVIDVNPVVSLTGVPDGVDIYEALIRRSIPGG